MQREALRGVEQTVRLSSIKTPLFLPSLVPLITSIIIPIPQPPIRSLQFQSIKPPDLNHSTSSTKPPQKRKTPPTDHEIPHHPPPRPHRHRHHRSRHARARRRPGIPLPRSPRRHARKTRLVQTPPPLPPGSGRHLRRYPAGEFLQRRSVVYGALPRGELCVVLYSVSLLICWDEGGRKGGGRGEGGDAVGWREGVCGSLSGCQKLYHRGGNKDLCDYCALE